MTPGQVKICVAEFVAALITIETFADECAGKLTYLELDNTIAHAWFEAARCPEFPFDHCAQGTHLYMLGRNMKVKTRWISTRRHQAIRSAVADWMSMLKYVR